MDKVKVGIVMGSASDRPIMDKAWQALADLKVLFEITVTSAHRSPDKTVKYASTAKKRGLKVIIAGAGGAAHLAGVIAAHTTLPVIGVPIPSSPMMGVDSLLSIVQMPPGVPVATVGIGDSGATNAGLLAAQILALSDPALQKRLDNYRKAQRKKVEKMNDDVNKYMQGKIG